MIRPSGAILGLHDETVVFRLSMQCKIEDVVLDGLAQVEVTIPGNEFVGQCFTAGHNFSGGRDDTAAPDHVAVFFAACFGRSRNPGTVLVGPGLK